MMGFHQFFETGCDVLFELGSQLATHDVSVVTDLGRDYVLVWPSSCHSHFQALFPEYQPYLHMQ
jgi:hypothetical protein